MSRWNSAVLSGTTRRVCRHKGKPGPHWRGIAVLSLGWVSVALGHHLMVWFEMYLFVPTNGG
jgi:hypothetical protein